ncbi:MAG TPA: lytic transglycosylase domain-containing protein [Clostridiales bacterium]|jgi:soluble lytic murein transglycosylase|nr:lytic transglycosylase domain-containing protein [Clostridiales bacterium]
MRKKRKQTAGKKGSFRRRILPAVLLAAAIFVGVQLLFCPVPGKIPYAGLIAAASAEEELDPFLVAAVIKTESSFDPEAISSRNARGLMQVIPETAYFVMAKTGHEFPLADLLEPERNIKTGCFYLSYLIKTFDDLDAAVAAYNAGPGNVKKWLVDPAHSQDGRTLKEIPFAETANYVVKVRKARADYHKRFGGVFPE